MLASSNPAQRTTHPYPLHKDSLAGEGGSQGGLSLASLLAGVNIERFAKDYYPIVSCGQWQPPMQAPRRPGLGLCQPFDGTLGDQISGYAGA